MWSMVVVDVVLVDVVEVVVDVVEVVVDGRQLGVATGGQKPLS